MGIYGLDASVFQGQPNWSQVKAAGKSFAIIRASYGLNQVDGSFDHNVAGLRAVGLGEGWYQYVLPQLASPEAHLDLLGRLLAARGGYRPGLKLCLDIEDPSSQGNLEEWAFGWLDGCRKRWGARTEDVWIYSYTSYFTSHGLTSARLGQFPCWLANFKYPSNPADPSQQPPPPPPWSTQPGGWKCWQYSNKGQVPGINGNVDLNWYDGPLTDFFPVTPPPQEDDMTPEEHQLLQAIFTNVGYLQGDRAAVAQATGMDFGPALVRLFEDVEKIKTQLDQGGTVGHLKGTWETNP